MDIPQRATARENPTDILGTEYKLNVALRDSYARNLVTRIGQERCTKDDQLLLNALPDSLKDPTRHRMDSKLYPSILADLLSGDRRGSAAHRKTATKLNTIRAVTSRVIKLQLDWWHDKNRLPSKQNVLDSFTEWLERTGPNDLITTLFTAYDQINSLVAKLNVVNGPNIQKFYRNKAWCDLSEAQKKTLREATSWSCKEMDLEVYWSQKMTIIRYKRLTYLLPRAYILEIYNKLSDMISLQYYTQLVAGSSLEADAVEKCNDFHAEMCQLALEYDNSYFDIARTLEALVTGETLIRMDGPENSSFLRTLSRNLEKGTGFRYIGSDLQRCLRRCTTPLMTELGCCSKLYGHPLVDIRLGLAEIHKTGTESAEVNMLYIRRCVNHAKINFIRNYILSHKRWPPVILDEGPVHPGILRAMMRNADPFSPDIVSEFGQPLPGDFEKVTLEKVLEFDPLENFLPYLKDRTISLCKSELLRNWIQGTDPGNKRPWAQTRLLLVFLLSPGIATRHQEYLADYKNSVSLEDLLDYLVIRIVPKEKELKVFFRGFGCNTYEERSRRIIQEENAMKFLHMFSDEQAMTLGELEIAHKLRSFRNIEKAYRGHTPIYICLDASRWCSRQRHEAVAPVAAEILDRVFGQKRFFEKTQKAFQKTFYYLEDEEEVLTFEGMSGGIEGLNQDTWVVAYLAQVKVTMDKFKLPFHCFCKGDDFRIIVLVPPEKAAACNINELKETITREIEADMTKFGHKIKSEDSYASKTYFCFSKVASVETVELPGAFRMIMKASGVNNALLKVLDEHVGAAFSNAHSASKRCTNALSCYCVGLLWALWYIIHCPEYNDLGVPQLSALLLVPSVLGGLPIIYLHNMYVRAESDLLSPAAHLYSYLRTRDPSVARSMKGFFQFRVAGKPNYEMLWRDPYAVRTGRPDLPLSVLRREIGRQLERVTANEEILELLEAGKSPEMLRLLMTMETMSVINPRIGANLYACSPKGLIEELVRRFEAGASIQQMLLLRRPYRAARRILGRILRTEQYLQKWRAECIQGSRIDGCVTIVPEEGMCPVVFSQALRQRCWKKPIEGVTMPPNQHLLEFVTEHEGSRDDHSRENHFRYEIKPSISCIENPFNQHWATSGETPFVGYKTSAGTITPQVSVDSRDAMLSKVSNLLTMAAWTDVEGPDQNGDYVRSNMRGVINALLKMYTRRTIEELAPFHVTKRSGTIQHHLRSISYNESIVPNQLSNIYQQIVGESNSHVTLNRTGSHYLVNFLHIYCHTIATIMHELEFRPVAHQVRYVWVVTSRCRGCSGRIHESPIVMDQARVNRLRFQALSCTRLSRIARQSIERELMKLTDRQFHRVEDDNPDHFRIMCLGVIQELMHFSSVHSQSLQQRYTAHTVTSESRSILGAIATNVKSRDLSLTELKRIDIETLGTCLLDLVYNHIASLPHTTNIDVFRSQLSSMEGMNLPWYGILDQLAKAGTLPKLIRWISSRSTSKPSLAYDSPEAAAKYIARVATDTFEGGTRPYAFVVLDYFTDGDILRSIKSRLTGILGHVMSQFYYPLLQAGPNNISEEFWFRTCSEALILSSLDVYNEEYLEHLKRQVLAGVEHDLVFIDVTSVNMETLEIYVEWPEERPLRMRLLMRTFSRIPWDRVVEFLEDYFDDAIVALSNLVRNECRIQVYYTNFAACQQHVRTHEIIADGDDWNAPFTPPAEAVVWNYDTTRSDILNVKLNGYVNEVMDAPAFEELDFTNPVLTTGVHHLARPFGRGTSGQNKLIQVLHAGGINPPLPDRLTIAALGEGYGGFLEVLLATNSECRVLFNIIPAGRLGGYKLTRGSRRVLSSHAITAYLQGISQMGSMTSVGSMFSKRMSDNTDGHMTS